MGEQVFGEDRKVKKVYQSPQSKDEARRLMETLAVRTFAKLKGRGLTIIESWFAADDSRLAPSKSLYSSMCADICNNLQKELDDILLALCEG